jgi:dimethylhistidine N-methyltransferase
MTVKSRAKKQPNVQNQFAIDVIEGLSRTPKKLSSKYFYDERGDKLFQDIMNMPEYYLTDCEYEIFDTHKQNLLNLIGKAPFDLIELGAGDGTKTKVLLRHLLMQNADFQYLPIDISENVLLDLEQDLKANLPALRVKSLPGDYFEILENLNAASGVRKVILFIGANIGNLTRESATEFLQHLNRTMAKGDLLLIGFDLKKDPQVILDAYNDATGITAAFNLNLLHRMNRELDADFQVDAFKHWETYNPATGETKSYIVSTQKQTVQLLDHTFYFDAWEAIDVELSQKYSLTEIENLAKTLEFRALQHFFDTQNYFVDTLWEKQL